MYTIKTTPQFDKWLSKIKDQTTVKRLHVRMRKVSLGNFGDFAPVGEGVFELREHFGAGWRMYYIRQADVIVVMLGGGDKSTQQTDIDSAIALSKIIQE